MFVKYFDERPKETTYKKYKGGVNVMRGIIWGDSNAIKFLNISIYWIFLNIYCWASLKYIIRRSILEKYLIYLKVVNLNYYFPSINIFILNLNSMNPQNIFCKHRLIVIRMWAQFVLDATIFGRELTLANLKMI